MLSEEGFPTSRVAGLANFGHRVFSEKHVGIWVLDATRATGFAIFWAPVSGIVVKMCRFSGVRRHAGPNFLKDI